MLAETQADFVQAILDPERAAIANAQDAKGEHAPKRFNVYRNNVIVSLVEAIGDGFPLVKRVVGDEFFEAMAVNFARQYPPRSPLMYLYGDAFANFIAGFEPAKSVGYLPDLARLEYDRRMAYFAADAVFLDLQSLQGLSQEAQSELELKLHPSVFCVSSSYPIFDIYKMLTNGDGIGGAPQEVLTYRKDFQVISRAAPIGFAAFLTDLGVMSLSDAVEALMARQPDADVSEFIALGLKMSCTHE